MAKVFNVNQIEQAIEDIKAGGVVFVYPTDTVYGIGCAITNSAAIERIHELKRRAKTKSFTVMFKDIRQIKKYAKVSAIQKHVLKKYLPGPFTFILYAKNETPSGVTGPNITVAVRIPESNLCVKLIDEVGAPIISTSLNISGQQVLTSPGQIPAEMLSEIDIILDSGTIGSTPSTIIDLTGEFPMIIRQGKGVFRASPARPDRN